MMYREPDDESWGWALWLTLVTWRYQSIRGNGIVFTDSSLLLDSSSSPPFLSLLLPLSLFFIPTFSQLSSLLSSSLRPLFIHFVFFFFFLFWPILWPSAP